MSASFLDTTIVVDLSDPAALGRKKAQTHITQNQPASAPYYALRELLAGHVQVLCDAHNVILASDTPAEAALALLNRSPAEGRKREAKSRALLMAMEGAFTGNPTGSRGELKREMLQNLAIRANRIWRKASAVPSFSLVQDLGCFNSGGLSRGPADELRGPRGSFNCIASERCAAAAYLYENKADVEKLIDALHPKNLGILAEKNENKQRRRALKDLLTDGPVKFDKGRCRAIGDAYFAAMCPAGASVVTTNVVDHVMLCAALGRKAVAP